MITVFANKSLLFRNPKTGEEAHIRAKELGKQLPDWIVNDPLFALAKADGSITAMGDSKKDKSIENGEFNKPGSLNESSGDMNANKLEGNNNSGENGEKQLSEMEVEELKAYAVREGIELGKATSKDGIIAKIKESEAAEK